MNFIIVDTETHDVPINYKLPPSAVNNWPRIVTIAWYRWSDGTFSNHYHVIKPDGWRSTLKALDIHKITHEESETKGEPIRDVLTSLAEDVSKAGRVICHNTEFDLKVIWAELIRAQMPDIFEGKQFLCTMKSTTGYCQIPGPYGNKWPKLEELYFKLFGEKFDGHNSAGDVAATLKCYLKLVEIGVIK